MHGSPELLCAAGGCSGLQAQNVLLIEDATRPSGFLAKASCFASQPPLPPSPPSRPPPPRVPPHTGSRILAECACTLDAHPATRSQRAGACQVPAPANSVGDWLQILDLGSARSDIIGVDTTGAILVMRPPAGPGGESEPLSEGVGTRLKRAPEVLAKQPYGQAVDGARPCIVMPHDERAALIALSMCWQALSALFGPPPPPPPPPPRPCQGRAGWVVARGQGCGQEGGIRWRSSAALKLFIT
jgi:hypothetical protein